VLDELARRLDELLVLAGRGAVLLRHPAERADPRRWRASFACCAVVRRHRRRELIQQRPALAAYAARIDAATAA
jgi:hypothetical protein